MDVHNAFLHGDLAEEVYMKLPPGFPSSVPGQVCRLKKSLYGLRQAPRNWFAKLQTSLRTFGFTQSKADYSLFSLITSSYSLHVLVYVDDLIVAGDDLSALEKFKSYIGSCFHMKDLGTLKYFLGIEIARSSAGIFLSQRKYTLDILADSGLLGAKPCDFPMEQHHDLALSESPLISDPEQYRRLIGKLIYLTITRLELSYSVHTLAQFMQSPRQDHWDASLRLLRYLNSHPATLLSSGTLRSHGRPRSSPLSLDRRLKLSTVLWPLLVLSFCGSSPCYPPLGPLILIPCVFSAIVGQLFILLLTPSSMSEPSILPSTATLSVISSGTAQSLCLTFASLRNLLIFLPRL